MHEPNAPSTPPIASPHGAGTFIAPCQPETAPIRIRGELRLAAVCRYALIEWLTPAMAGLGVLLLLMTLCIIPLPIMIIVLEMALLSTLTRLCSRRRFDVEISAAGITKRYPNRNIFYPWRKFIWVVEPNGDLWLASPMAGCFIPREAFASREESHELALFLRELKHSDGAAWHEEWNGRLFGAQNE